MKGIIYCATSPEGKKYYGRTIQSLSKRKYRHYYDARIGCNLYFHNAIRKYGEENIIWMVVERIEAGDKEKLVDLLNQREIQLISENNTLWPNGYNLSKGGGTHVISPTGKNHSGKTYEEIFGEKKAKEIKEKQSKNNAHFWQDTKQSEELIEKRVKNNRGKSRSEETKELIRKSLLGIKHSEERKKNNSEGHKVLKFN
jgi:group I intron endonuclease